MLSFGQLVHRATGFDPYPYQQRLADTGLPSLLRAPTGAGKTVAAVLPWLYRRRFHPDDTVRQSTPHWLVIALPLRTLVDQMEGDVADWLKRLHVDTEVGLHVLLGGRVEEGRRWADTPGQDAIMIGSIDMLLSRAMNRGYASTRYRWPIDFGMFNSGVQWVFDEVQLLGPALPTSRQLQAFRERFGTYLSTHSMWMSATVFPEWLSTVDAPDIGSVVEIGDDDRQGTLGVRTSASRTIQELDCPPVPSEIATAVVGRHRAGTRTICFVNTVAAARDLRSAISEITDVEAVLVHSRFRPTDRAGVSRRALDPDLGEAGRIVVTTQALEAGVDVTSSTLFTEAAPWTSIVQRAGRCNRFAETNEAELWWYRPATPHPYEQPLVDASVAALRTLEGERLTGEQLVGLVEEQRPLHPVLRRRDLIDLFDTTPTLSGEDIDISPYIRGDVERDVFVAWRDLPDWGPDSDTRLLRDELCRVPLAQARQWVKKLAAGPWRFDPEGGEWTRAWQGDLHPGLVLLVATSAGGYTNDGGWNPSIKTAVPQVPIPIEGVSPLDAASDEEVAADPLSHLGMWVRLSDHLRDTRQRLELLLDSAPAGIPEAIRNSMLSAAGLHDIGKVHPAFQQMLLDSAGHGEHPDPTEVWAKSSKAKRSRPKRRGLRHELVSALMLGAEPTRRLLPKEADLVRYLVAAHHGRVRLAIRPGHWDVDPDGTGRPVVLGVVDGETTPSLDLDDGRSIPPITMHVSQLPAMGGEGSWSRLALRLRDRPDLGPFRLAWMEALVRLADWQASAEPSKTIQVNTAEESTT